jgi:hypothetical protein
MIDFSFSDDAELQKLSAQVVSLLTAELLHALSQIARAFDKATY